jgi:hypothetical protein
MTGGYSILSEEWFKGGKLFVKFVKIHFARVLFPSTYVGANHHHLSCLVYIKPAKESQFQRPCSCANRSPLDRSARRRELLCLHGCSLNKSVQSRLKKAGRVDGRLIICFWISQIDNAEN